MNRKMQIGMSCLAVAAVVGLYGQANAQTIDGSLTAGDGYTLSSTQTNVTSSPAGGGPGVPATPTSYANVGSPYLTQVSNAYSKISGSTLNLFIGGSLDSNDGGVAHYAIALQTESGGVSSLYQAISGNNVIINGTDYQGNNQSTATAAGQIALTNSNPHSYTVGIANIAFDTGFNPNALLIVDPQGPGVYSGFTDLTGNGATASYTNAYNGALSNTLVGTGSAGSAEFAAANTGDELSIDLSNLGYTPGTDIEAEIFTFHGGNDGSTNNQVLAPFAYGSAPSDYDYTYLDYNRQFNNDADYPGSQYFTISAAPEPTSIALLGLGAAPMIFGRRRKQVATV